MKQFLTLLFILIAAVGAAFGQRKNPPAPLIYKAPVKADFKDFIAEDKSFSITFPGVPTTVKRDMNKAVATIRSVYRQGSNSMVTVFEFEGDIENSRETTFKLLKSSLQSQPKLKIEAERDIEVDGMPVKEFDYTEDLKFIKIRVFVSGKRIFELRSDVTNWGWLNQFNKDRVAEFEVETKRFFESFKLEKPKKETIPIGFLGITNETSYINNFLGISLDFPAGWHLEDVLEIGAETNVGLELLKTKEERYDRMLADVVKKEVIIFGVTNKESGESSGENLLIGVMKVGEKDTDPAVLVKNTRDFFLKNPKIKLHQDIKNEVIKGEKFSTLMFETTVEGIKIYQKLRLTIRKGYSVNFTISCLDADGCEPLEKVFDSLKLNTK